jgi:(p)ppGpp synthase/HD superfamily hydrolase
MNIPRKIEWCIEQHKKTNHKYDEYIDYEFHLRMVVATAAKYLYLLPDSNNGEESFRDGVILGAWGHDLIEDTRVSYNDVKEVLGFYAAEIIYAVSNEKGKTRKERANVAYYKGIRETNGAVFVKLCDRIANVQYSKMTGSRMFEMYKKENSNFIQELGWFGDVTDQLYPMFCDLQELFIEPRKEK